MVVPKKNGKWRVYIDYSNLNDTYSKDTFPLPQIDHIMDAIAGHQLLSLLNAYVGYNQIPMYPLDLEHTTFITSTRMYRHNVMPFGLKNVGTVYQRMMSHIFKPLLGNTMEAHEYRVAFGNFLGFLVS